ncbi:MAG TPA: TIGR03086 family metal-binding protein [Pilimelia sp.]|nr:TIGR03086 family metal-binding protein [Pilimelia sp.]
MSEIADRYRRLAEELTRRVAAVPADRWESPSPCAGWTARDVLRHLVTTHGDMLGYVGLSLGEMPSVDDDPVGAWAAVRARTQAVLDDPELAGREYDGLFGRTKIEDTLDTFQGMDLLIHSWDIARATGGDERLDPAEVEWASAFVRTLGDGLRGPNICGPEVPVAEGADAQTRLLAYLGRTP